MTCAGHGRVQANAARIEAARDVDVVLVFEPPQLIRGERGVAGALLVGDQAGQTRVVQDRAGIDARQLCEPDHFQPDAATPNEQAIVADEVQAAVEQVQHERGFAATGIAGDADAAPAARHAGSVAEQAGRDRPGAG